MRLNKLLAQRGLCSRRDADDLIAKGKVKVNGQLATLGQQVDEANDLVEVNGSKLNLEASIDTLFYAYYKPVGVECTHDELNEAALFKHVQFPGRVTYIGRLDKASEGLLLLTNRGDLINPINRSRNNHEKEYEVLVSRDLSEKEIVKFASGVDIGDPFPTKYCDIDRLGPKLYNIIITEGRNRQIRRMFQAFNIKVFKLKRVRVMHVKLGDLEEGRYRSLEKEELSKFEELL